MDKCFRPQDVLSPAPDHVTGSCLYVLAPDHKHMSFTSLPVRTFLLPHVLLLLKLARKFQVKRKWDSLEPLPILFCTTLSRLDRPKDSHRCGHKTLGVPCELSARRVCTKHLRQQGLQATVFQVEPTHWKKAPHLLICILSCS